MLKLKQINKKVFVIFYTKDINKNINFLLICPNRTSPLRPISYKKFKKFMISTATRIRIKNILNRLESNQLVTLEERIFLNKLSNVSPLVSEWVASALGAEASSIDNE